MPRRCPSPNLDGRTASAGEDLASAHHRMVTAGRRRLAVVGPGGQLLGLLCLRRDGRGFCTDEGVAAREVERTATDNDLYEQNPYSTEGRNDREADSARGRPGRRPPVPTPATVTVVVGGEAGGPDVGLVRAPMFAGAGMPAHRHNGSDAILTAAIVRISRGEDSIDVHVGDSALVNRDEEVASTNPGSQDAELIVAAGPADFIAGIRAWPGPDAR